MQKIEPPLNLLICDRAVKFWGMENQADVAVEECSELVKALMKYRRYNHTEEWRAKVVEEMADVSIMLDQMVMMFSSDAEFAKAKNYKLQRLAKMLDAQVSKQTCESHSDSGFDLL